MNGLLIWISLLAMWLTVCSFLRHLAKFRYSVLSRQLTLTFWLRTSPLSCLTALCKGCWPLWTSGQSKTSLGFTNYWCSRFKTVTPKLWVPLVEIRYWASSQKHCLVWCARRLSLWRSLVKLTWSTTIRSLRTICSPQIWFKDSRCTTLTLMVLSCFSWFNN